ncbi:T9SS type B sorting domain-containing protein [Cryomorpha ignava]|uniref:T9SS type B sorting domain-containing protein n=1 Tax=Cryomorpha ignava TaxID=101383 RepID=A0A7K3WQ35_9FLAO|nr:gliding motility-associated C-terminal domain-containing protein [Cryomorpha ignava]NEN23666.1 T9SS type B sorting domain-containing protein [Cryomorpha ignava]
MRIYQLLLFVFVFAAANVSAQHRFIENGGQWNHAVKYRADIPGGKVYFESDRFTFDLYDVETTSAVFSAHSGNPNPMPPPEKLKCHAYQMIFKNASGLPSGEKAFDTDYNFYIGNDPTKWAGNLKAFEAVRYTEIYQGIDLKVYSNAVLKYDFILKPGASPGLIQIEYAGVKPKINSAGQLEISTSVGDVLESKPFAYQIINGNITKVECKYVLSRNILGFELGDYDPSRELIIDPELIFSTFSGSFADNFGYSATYDSQGFLYSGSSAFGTGYPVTIGAYQATWAGGEGQGSLTGTDIAITKYSLDGTSLIYSTYLGGAKDDLPHSLIVNDNNELYVYGTSGSANFPTTTNAFQTTFAGGTLFVPGGIGVSYQEGTDIIVSRLSANGGSLLSSTYLGGQGNDGINSATSLKKNYADEMRGEIEIDGDGNIIIGSHTYSDDFPVSESAFQTVKDVGQDGILVRMNPDLSEVLAATFFGGDGADAIYSIDATYDRRITVAGGTTSLNLPTSANAFQTEFGGIADGFIAVFNEDMQSLNAMTYYGSSAYDQIYFVERDDVGRPHIYGQTRAPDNTFIDNADYAIPNSGMLLSSFSDNLDSRTWSTVFGNGQNIPNLSPTAFSVDICNRIYLSGWGGPLVNGGVGGTNGLPITSDAIQATTDNNDFYFMVLEGDASALTFASFYGGNQSAEHVDGGTSRFDKSGKIYQAACAGCGSHDDWPAFPSNAYSPTNNSTNCNLGVVKIDFDLPLIFADFEAENFCLPDSIVLENTSTLYSGSNPNYQWLLPDGTFSFNENYTFHPGNSGTFEIALVVTDPDACNISDTIVKTVTVYPELEIMIADTLTSCTSTNFTVTANSQGSASSYQWATDPNFTTTISTDSSFTYNPDSDQTIYLLTSNGLCQSVDSIFLSPKPDLQISLSDTLLCAVQELPISVSLSGNVDAATFDWLPDDKIISGDSTQNIVLDASETVTLTASANTEYGCELTASIEITVNPISLETNSDTLACLGEPLMLSANSNGLAQSFLWSTDSDFGSLLNPSGDSTITVTPTSITYYYIKAVNGGCSLIDSIAVSLLSAGTSVSANQYICIGDTARITVSNDFPGNKLSHIWEPEEYILSGQGSTQILVLVNEPTTFTVISSTSQGCSVENSTTVYVSSLGSMAIEASADPENILEGGSSTLTALPAADFYNYQWSPPQTLASPNSRITTASPMVTTTYEVLIIDNGEFGTCLRRDSVTIYVFEAICGEPNIFIPNTFTPNSDGENDEVWVRGGNITDLEFSIFNRWGELVFKTTNQSIGWDGSYKGNLAEPAVYVFHLRARCGNGQEYFTKGNITLLR